MSILCKLFGHKMNPRDSWYGSQGRIGAPYHDGIGGSHRDIKARCVRCDTWFKVISVIDPVTSLPPRKR